jgi:hypothetical protein
MGAIQCNNMSFQTDAKRILRWGLISFYRNTVVSGED